ncbi:DUF1648 domain-containing protein [Microbacterium sp. NPDC055357]
MTGPVSARLRAVGLIAPIVLAVVGVIIQAICLPRLPARIAIHWGLDGQADGYAPAWLALAMTAVIGILLPLIVVGSALMQSRVDPRWGQRGGSYRFIGGVSLGTTAFIVVMMTSTVLTQVGIENATDAPAIWLSMLAGAVAGVIGGAIARAALPAGMPRPRVATADPLPLADNAQAVWIRTAVMSRGGVLVLAGGVVLLVAIGIGMILAGESGPAWIVLGLGALIALLAASNTVFHVVVDASGLTVRSALGVPRFRIAASDVTAATASHVNPMAEFGGWGMRWSPDRRFGVVLRTGSCIEVTRSNGRTFVVTVDDAATGAALLNTMAARASGPHRIVDR